MRSHLHSYKIILSFFSLIDVVTSFTVVVAAILYIYNCEVESISAISYNVTLEQIVFFYDALKDCKYIEENAIPSSETVCRNFNCRVAPVTIISGGLNLLVAALILTLPIKHGQTALDDGLGQGWKMRKNKSAQLILALIFFGTLLEMCLGVVGLMEYNHPTLCWMQYSITKMRKSPIQFNVTIAVIVLICFYKPIELWVILMYGSQLINNTLVDPSGSATLNLGAQLEDDSNSQTNILTKASKPPEKSTVHLQPVKDENDVAILVFAEKKHTR